MVTYTMSLLSFSHEIENKLYPDSTLWVIRFIHTRYNYYYPYRNPSWQSYDMPKLWRPDYRN
jgi:hypothetical protein